MNQVNVTTINRSSKCEKRKQKYHVLASERGLGEMKDNKWLELTLARAGQLLAQHAMQMVQIIRINVFSSLTKGVFFIFN